MKVKDGGYVHIFTTCLSAITLCASTTLSTTQAINQNNQAMEIIDNEKSSPITIKAKDPNRLPSHIGTMEEISKFSLLAKNWEFFTKLKTDEEIGYSSLDPEKFSAKTDDFIEICEYVSLTMLYTYFYLYWDKPMYSSLQIETYFKNNILTKTNFEHKSSQSRRGTNAGAAYDIWDGNDRKLDLKNGSLVRRASKRYLDLLTHDDYSAAWMHSSQPEDWIKKHHAPVMLVSGNYAHSFIIYGYNAKTNEYAMHYGTYLDHMHIVKKDDIWWYYSMGYWYGLYY